MKKLILSSLVVISIVTFAYNQTALDSANFLAGKGIITQQSDPKNYRLDDYITRAELVGISLKLKGTTLPENYQCKKYFSDVVANDWICRAVEIAADEGLISRTNKKFDPQRNITRSESLAIILKASGLLDKVPDLANYIDPDFVFVPRNINIENYLTTLLLKDPGVKNKRIILVDILDWQFTTIKKGLYLKVINLYDDFFPGNEHDFRDGKNNPASDYRDYDIWSFGERFFIRRDDAFEIMKKTYDKRELVSGEVSI